MAETKECFGRCGGLTIKYRDQVKEHYVVSDPEKMKECTGCRLYGMCLFETFADHLKYVVRLVDKGRDARPRIG